MTTTTIIYGAGGVGHSLLPKIKADIFNAGKQVNLTFADGNPALWGTKILGLPVMNPMEITNIEFDRVIITTAQGMETVTAKLKNELGISEDKIDSSFVSPIVERTFETRNRWLKRFAEMVYARKIPGNCVEGGVFEGYFAKRINAAFPDRTLYLFDTFEGFDKRDIEKETGFVATRAGGFNIQAVPEKIKSQMPNPEQIIVAKGYFPETAKGIDDTFVFVNLDFDLYAPTLSGLELFYPRLVGGG
jgi:hypothetical protein